MPPKRIAFFMYGLTGGVPRRMATLANGLMVRGYLVDWCWSTRGWIAPADSTRHSGWSTSASAGPGCRCCGLNNLTLGSPEFGSADAQRTLEVVRLGGWSGAIFAVAASFAANLALTVAGGNDAFFLPVTRFWELMTGAFLVCSGAPVSPNASARAAAMPRRWRPRRCCRLGSFCSRRAGVSWLVALLPVLGPRG